MGNSELNEHLKPETRPSPPPWLSRSKKKNYNGRLEWWADLNYKDELSRNNVFRGKYYQINEHDPYWYDPPVPDGTSISGPLNLDSKYNKNLTLKGDQTGNFFEFQKKIMETSSQYQQISKKWELSKEHPGLNVNPTLDNINLIPFSQLGKAMAQLIPNSWIHYGPRFWDKPLNEGCFEKGLCGVKYGCFGALIYGFFDIKARPPEGMPYTWGIQQYFRRSLKHMPLPCALAFTYNVSLCTSATVRNKDDTYNFLYASSALGLTLATIKENIPAGVILCLATFFAGVMTQYARTCLKGLQNGVIHQSTSGLHFGPLSWKYFSLGDAEIPDKTY